MWRYGRVERGRGGGLGVNGGEGSGGAGWTVDDSGDGERVSVVVGGERKGKDWTSGGVVMVLWWRRGERGERRENGTEKRKSIF